MTQKTAHARLYYGWFIVAVGFLAMAIIFVIGYSANSLYIDPLSQALSIPRSQVSLFITGSSIASLIATPIVGRLLKRFKVRWLMSTFTAFFALAMLGISRAAKPWQFYALFAARGIAMVGCTSMVASVMVNNWFGVKSRGLATGIVMVGSNIGSVALLPVITSLIQNLGWRWSMAISAAMVAVMVPVMLIFISQSPEEKGLVRQGDDPEAEKAAQTAGGVTTAEALRQVRFWLLMGGCFMLSMVSTALMVHNVSYFTDIGYSATQAAAIASVALALSGAAKLVMGKLSDRIGITKSTIIGMSAMTLCVAAILLMSVSHAFMQVHVALFALGITMGLLTPPLLTAGCYGGKNYSMIYSLVNMGSSLGTAAGSYLIPKIAEAGGGYTAAWLATCAFSIVSMALFLAVAPRKRAAK